MKLNGQVIVAIVAAACLMAETIIAKNVLNVQLDFASQYWPTWFVILYLILPNETKKSKCSSAWLWSLVMIAVTAAILLVYAL